MGRVRRSRRSVQRHEPFLQVKADLLEEQRQENNCLLLSLMHNGLPQNPYRRRVAMARVREAQGDLPPDTSDPQAWRFMANTNA